MGSHCEKGIHPSPNPPKNTLCDAGLLEYHQGIKQLRTQSGLTFRHVWSESHLQRLSAVNTSTNVNKYVLIHFEASQSSFEQKKAKTQKVFQI